MTSGRFHLFATAQNWAVRQDEDARAQVQEPAEDDDGEEAVGPSVAVLLGRWLTSPEQPDAAGEHGPSEF